MQECFFLLDSKAVPLTCQYEWNEAEMQYEEWRVEQAL
jgi:hypothetical protein